MYVEVGNNNGPATVPESATIQGIGSKRQYRFSQPVKHLQQP
jgi:hypothetical protein